MAEKVDLKLPNKEVFEKLLRKAIHTELSVVDISQNDFPDYVVGGADRLVKTMLYHLYTDVDWSDLKDCKSTPLQPKP